MPTPPRKSFNEPSRLEVREYIRAAQDGNIQAVTRFLDRYKDAVDIVDSYGSTTALGSAAWASDNNGPMVEFLIKRGANVDLDVGSGTPLLEACGQGHIKIVEILLKYSADINKPDETGWTPLMQAVYYAKKDIVLLLLAHSARWDPKNEEGKTAWEIADAASRNVNFSAAERQTIGEIAALLKTWPEEQQKRATEEKQRRLKELARKNKFKPQS
jgi:ankyrin repeat protein